MTLIGAVGVPAAPLISVVAEAPAGAPDPLVAPAAPLGSLQGIALLDRLSTLPRGELRSYLGAHPDVVTELLTDPPTAAIGVGMVGVDPVRRPQQSAGRIARSSSADSKGCRSAPATSPTGSR